MISIFRKIYGIKGSTICVHAGLYGTGRRTLLASDWRESSGVLKKLWCGTGPPRNVVVSSVVVYASDLVCASRAPSPSLRRAHLTKFMVAFRVFFFSFMEMLVHCAGAHALYCYHFCSGKFPFFLSSVFSRLFTSFLKHVLIYFVK